MANTIVTRTLHDGARNHVVFVYIASDNASGEISDQIIVDVSTLVPAATVVTLEKVWASTSGCAVVLEWDADTDAGLFSIPSDVMEEFDFCSFGGIDNSLVTGATGDVFLSTNGFTATGDRATLILSFRKD